jgi:hypothetical protein
LNHNSENGCTALILGIYIIQFIFLNLNSFLNIFNILASRVGHTEIVEILKSAGAK